MGFLSIIDEVAERAIKAAQERGEFDNLQGMGRPLVLEDDSMIPEDLRMAYKVLRNSGHLPPEMQQEKDIQRALDLLENCRDEQAKLKQMQKLNLMITKLNMGRKRPIQLEKNDLYYDKVTNRVRVAGSGEGGGT
ncbi:DnaJ family domain-containing protein [Desulfocurvus sp. DL9XJH121]